MQFNDHLKAQAREAYEASSGVLPPGRYNVRISKVEDMDSDTAEGLNVIYTVTDGPYNGLTIFDRFALEVYAANDPANEKARQRQRIGLSDFYSLLEACGLKFENLQTSDQLLNYPLTVEVVHKEYNGRTYSNVKKREKQGGFVAEAGAPTNLREDYGTLVSEKPRAAGAADAFAGQDLPF